jgi:hypothetical protein
LETRWDSKKTQDKPTREYFASQLYSTELAKNSCLNI